LAGKGFGDDCRGYDWPESARLFRATPADHGDCADAVGVARDSAQGVVEAACVEALDAGVASGDVILTVLARQRQPAAPPSVTTPDALRLKIEPAADCGRYDSIRKVA
jgi:hypothetical protein